MNQLKPVGDRVLVEPDAPKDTTSSGLYISETAHETHRGTVLDSGFVRTQDGREIALAVKPGDVVLYRKFAGLELENDGKKLRLLSESEVLCIINQQPA